MRISDWSSDVCSSDLGVRHRIDRIFEDAGVHREMVIETQYATTICALVMQGVGCSILNTVTAADYAERGLTVRDVAPEANLQYMLFTPTLRQIGRSRCRESVCSYV